MNKAKFNEYILKNFYYNILHKIKLPQNIERSIPNAEQLLQIEISNIKSDNDNFLSNELKFTYNSALYKNKRGLSKDNYSKLLADSSIQDKDKIKYIIAQKIIHYYSDSDFLSKHFPIPSDDEKESKLTIKQWYNYKIYYQNSDRAERCPFCGQKFQILNNENDEKYYYADIEHLIPKTKYPQFAFNTYNWIPCCKACNMGIKGDDFFTSIEEFKQALSEIKYDIHSGSTLCLYKYITIQCKKTNYTADYFNVGQKAMQLFNLYDLKNRANSIVENFYRLLFNIIKHSDIRSPESLEKLLENIASSNWHEINDGYSLNNSPQIWQEFIENILYDECKLMALWDEIKASRLQLL